ncbi:Protein Peter pan [Eumeta japonica]|uniref:Protein Peter pan n=1 Tax=Eumeta variegata TaxID=151549 RepID=A0A4C1ZB14_EUMVA|nr:Protein Peter pan [Eumeta japonica]
MGRRKGRCTKKNASKQAQEPEHLVKAPHSFVIHRGHCCKDLIDLTKDFREIMEPFTASQLKKEPGRPGHLAGVDKKLTDKEEISYLRIIKEEKCRANYYASLTASTSSYQDHKMKLKQHKMKSSLILN